MLLTLDNAGLPAIDLYLQIVWGELDYKIIQQLATF